MNNVPISSNKLTISPSLNEQIQNMQTKPVQPKVDVELKPDTVELSTPAPSAAPAQVLENEKPAAKAEPPEVQVRDDKKVKKEKKSLLERFANFVGSMKKMGVNISEYTKGGAKGIGSFAVGGAVGIGAIFTADKIKQGIKVAKKEGQNKLVSIAKTFAEGVSNNFKPAHLKSTLKSAKGILAILGGVVLGSIGFIAQIYKAKLAANERNAMLDHKYVNTPVIPK